MPSTPLSDIKKRLQNKADEEGLTYKEARRIVNEEEKRLMRLEQMEYSKKQDIQIVETRRIQKLNNMYATVWQFAIFFIMYNLSVP